MFWGRRRVRFFDGKEEGGGGSKNLRDRVDVGNSRLGELDGSQSQNTIDTLESLSGTGGANRLGLHREATKLNYVGVLAAGEGSATVADGNTASGALSCGSALTAGLGTAPGVGSCVVMVS